MALSMLWAQLRSKDPNTKVGACVYHPRSGATFLGYNGFPVGVPDLRSVWDQRDRSRTPNKYQYVVHAETNAIRRALSVFSDLAECLLYVTHFPCHHCMKDSIIPSGLKSVVYMNPVPVDPVTDDLARVAKVTLQKCRTEFTLNDQTLRDWREPASKSITLTDVGQSHGSRSEYPR
jgi:deoxycytidylate deaminase